MFLLIKLHDSYQRTLGSSFLKLFTCLRLRCIIVFFTLVFVDDPGMHFIKKLLIIKKCLDYCIIHYVMNVFVLWFPVI